MITAALAATISLFIGVVLYRVFIPVLRKVKLGQTILEIGPAWHKSKEGTPIMGGVFIIISTLIAFFAVMFFTVKSEYLLENPLILINIGMMIANALIGFIDDYVKLFKKRNKGLSAAQKMILQTTVAALYLWACSYIEKISTSIYFPFIDKTVDLGIFYYILALVVIVYIINCANLTDGIDGLAGSVATVIAVAFLLVASHFGIAELEIFQSALIGGLLAFLIFNFHPAKIFMGDCGSLFLGAALVSAVAQTSTSYLILIAGFIYVFEGISVILQVASFKLTGKRIFKMAPIHHHFEMKGWSEVKIVGVFSFITACLCALTYYFAVNGSAILLNSPQ